MNKEIKAILVNTIGTILCFTVIFFFVTQLLFNYNKVDASFKESWGASLSFFSVLATIGAAIIAAGLFSDWRVLEDHKTKNEHISNAINSFLDLQASLKTISVQALNITKICSSSTLTFDQKLQIITDINAVQHEVLFGLRALKIHIQVFATVSDSLGLCSEYEKVITEVENNIQNRVEPLLNAVESSPPAQILRLYQAYLNYASGELVATLHKKIIINLSKNAKALN